MPFTSVPPALSYRVSSDAAIHNQPHENTEKTPISTSNQWVDPHARQPVPWWMCMWFWPWPGGTTSGTAKCRWAWRGAGRRTGCSRAAGCRGRGTPAGARGTRAPPASTTHQPHTYTWQKSHILVFLNTSPGGSNCAICVILDTSVPDSGNPGCANMWVWARGSSIQDMIYSLCSFLIAYWSIIFIIERPVRNDRLIIMYIHNCIKCMKPQHQENE